MKKAVVFMAIMLALTILSTGTVFAAENGFAAKESIKNPAFEIMHDHMPDDMKVVENVNNKNLHFSSMGYIMIPGNGADKAKSFVFESEMDMGHLAPPGRVKEFKESM